MSKRVLIGLLTASVVAMWGTEANAFNKINGVTIKHSDLTVEVSLTGAPAAGTLLTVAADVTVEIICKGPQGQATGQPEEQDVTVTQTAGVTSDDFDTGGHALVILVFDFSSLECHQNNFIQVADSELALSVFATTTWKKCNGKEPGADGINDGDPCFEHGGTVETVNRKPIESLQTTCGAGVRDPDGSVPPQELPCESAVVS